MDKLVKGVVEANPVFLFSKTYCGYCKRVKSLLDKIKIPYVVWEVDLRDDGDAIMNYLGKLTGETTVPRVFVGGKFIGGCDDTLALHNSGKLTKILLDAGVQPNTNNKM